MSAPRPHCGGVPAMRRAGLAALAAVTMGGCTTVVKGLQDDFRVDTVPPGAVVTTSLPARSDGRATGCEATPCEFAVSRKKNFVATVSKPGYHDVRIVVRPAEFVRARIDDVEAVQVATSNSLGVGATDAVTLGVVSAANASVFSSSLMTLAGQVTSSSAAALQSVFYAGPVAVGIDTATGSAQNLAPNPVRIVLIPDTEAVPDSYRLRQLPSDDRTLARLLEGTR